MLQIDGLLYSIKFLCRSMEFDAKRGPVSLWSPNLSLTMFGVIVLAWSTLALKLSPKLLLNLPLNPTLNPKCPLNSAPVRPRRRCVRRRRGRGGGSRRRPRRSPARPSGRRRRPPPCSTCRRVASSPSSTGLRSFGTVVLLLDK